MNTLAVEECRFGTTIKIAGTLESIGKTIFGEPGVEIRTADKKLISIPGLTQAQISELAPLLFKGVTVVIAEAA